MANTGIHYHVKPGDPKILAPVAPDGFSGMRCCVCDGPVTFEEMEEFPRDESLNEFNLRYADASWHVIRCGTAMRYMSVILTDSVGCADPTRVLELEWAHATNRGPRWLADAQEAGILVHLGVGEDVEQRANSIRARYRMVVKVKPGVQLLPHVMEDVTSHCDSQRCWDSWFPNASGMLYVNRWEAPGSVSLHIKATDLELVSYTKNKKLP